MLRPLLRYKLFVILALGAGLARATDGLPLNAGTYVLTSYKPCAEAPFAGVKDFDGTSFGGPHDSDCHTVILSRHSASYRVMRTCNAAGDGTPVTQTGFVEKVRIESRTAFVVTHGKQQLDYTLCPTFHY